MKNIISKIKFIAAAALVGTSVSSCSLDLLPLNEVVLENYWTNKSDVESVVASCYLGMTENGYVSSMIVWGENRSDNITAGPNVPATLNNLMKGSLKTTNSYCSWSSMYNVINRCNTVLYYAPQVAEKDPNYTTSDLKINIAECKALRAISYLTLIKTFKDVPFTLTPSIDDDMDYRLGQTKFEVVLDSLIKDIESCKNDAPRRYSTSIYNTGKITRAAMYSILAELYLWRASDYQLTPEQQNAYYRKCIEACDWVLNFKIDQYNANDYMDRYGDVVDLTKSIDTEVWTNYGYPLLAEKSSSGSSSRSAAAFNEIFGEGNSYESIFELTYHGTTSQIINEDVGFMYGGHNAQGNEVRYVRASDDIMTQAPTGESFSNQTLFSVSTDYRSLVPFRYTENGAFDIQKYSVEDVDVTYTGTGKIDYSHLEEQRTRSHSEMYPNWIFYRMTEIMLFRAEAEIELAGNLSRAAAPTDDETSGDDDTQGNGDEGDGDDNGGARPRRAGSIAVDGAGLVTAEELYDDAFNLISAVYVRSNPATKTSSGAKPARADFKELADFETLLMFERQRELLFEGKRYFDLVRQARREGNTNKFILALASKFGDGGAAVGIKMRQMDFMYMPILKSQMQVNPNLVQNSAYLDEEEIVKN